MNKKYKICVVGAGHWGSNHVRTLHQLDALGGVVEKSSSINSKLKSQYPYCSTFSDLENSFEENFDGYIISTPPISHYKIAKKIISMDKPVLIEKPMTLDLNESIRLNEIAKKNNVNLMVGHLLLFHPAFKKIKELIINGKIGKIQYIYSNRLNLGSFRNDENVLWSFAPHDIALFNYFFEDSPSEIISNGIDLLQEGIHDTSITTFKYSKNMMGHIFVSWLHPFKEHRFVIVGSKGMVHFEDTGVQKPLIFYDKTVDLKGKVPRSKLGSIERIEYENELPLVAELKYFISKIGTGKIELADGDSAVEVMRVLEKATNRLNNSNNNVN